MTFKDNARLDPSQVEDRRGGGRIGGSVGGPAVVGGGLGGIVLLVIYLLLGGNPGDLGGTGLGGGTADLAPENTAIAANCQTGADANTKEECRIVGFVNSIQAYWTTALPAAGTAYQPARTRFFDGVIPTGCGTASPEVGPFYCPADHYVYIDLGFFDQLESQFGASGGPLAQGYVMAHEYGHHIQNLLGILDRGQDTGAGGGAVRIELMADCLAGVWAGNAVSTGFLEPITQAQINDALSAAAAVGDDRIQSQTQGRVNPEAWTHGSSEQRQRWFTNGYNGKNLDSCDTFAGNV